MREYSLTFEVPTLGLSLLPRDRQGEPGSSPCVVGMIQKPELCQGVLPGDQLSRVNGVPLQGTTFAGESFFVCVVCVVVCGVVYLHDASQIISKFYFQSFNLRPPIFTTSFYFIFAPAAVARIKTTPRPMIVHFIQVISSSATAAQATGASPTAALTAGMAGATISAPKAVSPIQNIVSAHRPQPATHAHVPAPTKFVDPQEAARLDEVATVLAAKEAAERARKEQEREIAEYAAQIERAERAEREEKERLAREEKERLERIEKEKERLKEVARQEALALAREK